MLKIAAFQVPVSVWILIVVSSFMVTFIQVPEACSIAIVHHVNSFEYFFKYFAIIRLDLIRNSARSHPQLDKISTATLLDLIRNSARSHPQLG